jgi:pimeloyl-ACP methyl ester carboxylesterase
MAEDVYQLTRHLGHEVVSVVGHDIGLMVAYAMATAHPEAVQRLVLVDAVLPGTTVFDQAAASPAAWHFAFHAKRGEPDMLVTGREGPYLTAFYRELAYDSTSFTAARLAPIVRAYTAPGALRAGFELYRAIPADVRANRAAMRVKLPMPVLALGGERSTGPFLVAMAREIATDVRGGAVPCTGHWVPEENPAYVAAQLRTFLRAP